jgi:hypothetical protein
MSTSSAQLPNHTPTLPIGYHGRISPSLREPRDNLKSTLKPSSSSPDAVPDDESKQTGQRQSHKCFQAGYQTYEVVSWFPIELILLPGEAPAQCR